jgi:hypothetical protein
MNRPAATVAAWWAHPLDIDAIQPGIPLPRDGKSAARDEPFRARFARLMRHERPRETAPGSTK